MVIEDITTPKKSVSAEPQEEKKYRVANPLDRMAAFVIDFFIIFMPLISLVLAPLHSELTYLVFVDDQIGLVALIVKGLFLTVSLYMFYQIYFLTKYGATPGKMIYKLKVIHFFTEENPSMMSAFFRTFFQIVQMMMGFIPFLGLLSAGKSRSFHDRIVETMVVTDREDYKYPHTFELSFVRGMYSSFIILFLLVFIIPILSRINMPEPTGLVEQESVVECNAKLTDLSEYLVHRVSGGEVDICVEDLVDQAIMSVDYREHGYFLKFLNSQSRKIDSLKASYAKRLCKVSNSFCLMAQNEINNTLPVFSTKSYRKDPIFMNWMLSTASRLENYEALNVLLKNKNLFKQNYSYNFANIKSAIATGEIATAESLLGKAAKSAKGRKLTQLLTWTCNQRLQSGCSGMISNSCDAFENQYLSAKELTELAELTFVGLKECKSEKVNYKKLREQVVSENVKLYLNVLSLVQRKDYKPAFDAIKLILKSSDYSHDLKLAAAQKLIKLDASGEMISEAYKWWESSPVSLSWFRLGSLMIKTQVDRHAFEHALKISSRMQGYLPFSMNDKMNLVVASYSAGLKLDAKKWLDQIPNGISSDQARSPASANIPFTAIAKKIRGEFK